MSDKVEVKVYATGDDESGNNAHVIGVDEEHNVYVLSEDNGDVSLNAHDGVLDLKMRKVNSETEQLIELHEIEDADVDKFGMFVGIVFVE